MAEPCPCSWCGSVLFDGHRAADHPETAITWVGVVDGYESVVDKLVVHWLVVKSDFVQLSLNVLLAHVHFIGQLLQ